MIGADARPMPAAASPPEERRRLPLLDHYLREQQRLTAVERFERAHDAASLEGRYFRDVLPAGPPAEGQQYAFQVDLDACTSCKACVSACHSLNGLDEGETWRSVGLLLGGSAARPFQQAVTTACHHCLDPACLRGCPVGAYEKDPRTGIVKHLDDQCIGCQYCILTCPYDVPQYNDRLGIVRKCDMCSGRLAAGEAPACVQGCPNEAISITVVDARQVVEDAQADAFLPGTPSPAITLPATVYKTERALPRNLLPADFFALAPSHRHTPLVVMLVLTQLSAGAFAVDAIARLFFATDVLLASRPAHALVALASGVVALAASVFHLGRPRYAFRALLGLRTSWMSREILAFGVFAALAAIYAISLWSGRAPQNLSRYEGALGALVAAVGAAGVASSVLVYHVTKRSWALAPSAGFKFGMTSVVLGLGTTIVTALAGAAAQGGAAIPAEGALLERLTRLLSIAALVKLAWEASVFRHLGDKRRTDRQRTARLLTEDLAPQTALRFAAGALGGLVLPQVALRYAGEGRGVALAAASVAALVAGEMLERTLFFRAASSPGMPGGVA